MAGWDLITAHFPLGAVAVGGGTFPWSLAGRAFFIAVLIYALFRAVAWRLETARQPLDEAPVSSASGGLPEHAKSDRADGAGAGFTVFHEEKMPRE